MYDGSLYLSPLQKIMLLEWAIVGCQADLREITEGGDIHGLSLEEAKVEWRAILRILGCEDPNEILDKVS